MAQLQCIAIIKRTMVIITNWIPNKRQHIMFTLFLSTHNYKTIKLVTLVRITTNQLSLFSKNYPVCDTNKPLSMVMSTLNHSIHIYWHLSGELEKMHVFICALFILLIIIIQPSSLLLVNTILYICCMCPHSSTNSKYMFPILGAFLILHTVLQLLLFLCNMRFSNSFQTIVYH